LPWAFVALVLWLALGFALAVASGAPRATDARIAGLPWAAALVLYGLGAVPAVLLPLLYAWAHTTTDGSEDGAGAS
jgi:hypothetical protein